MELRLSGEVVDKLAEDNHPIAKANRRYRSDSQALTIDLAKYELEVLVSLHDTIEAMSKKEPKNGYLKHQAREVRMWLAIMEDPSETIGKLHRLPSMLRELLKKRKVFRLYKQETDASSIWLPYAVTSASFTPGSRRTGPSYVTISLAYYQEGVVKNDSIRYYDRVVDKTVEQVLSDRGFRLETKELYEAWQADCERYLKLRGNYGFQVLGTGFGIIESGENYFKRKTNRALAPDGVKSRLVVHVEENKDPDKPATADATFWESRRSEEDEELKQMNFQKKVNAARKGQDWDEALEIDPHEDDGEEKSNLLDVPLHAYTRFFDLEKHYELDAHVRSVEDYIYDKNLGEKLVLPDDVKDLVEMLLDETAGNFKDIIVGKNAGTVVMLMGPPGSGKTLTAEVFAEATERPLYKIQSSQLGTSPESLEEELKEVLGRAALWNALLIIDECDVFVHERGDDLIQNAVVGVFLRVLEYFQGVLFLTTNRETLVDDAIMSRCTACIKYDYPDAGEQFRIWQILSTGAGIPIKDDTIHEIVEKYPRLAGRDVKNLLKLGDLVRRRRKKKEMTLDIVDFIVRFMWTPSLRKEGDLVDHVAKKVKA